MLQTTTTGDKDKPINKAAAKRFLVKTAKNSMFRQAAHFNGRLQAGLVFYGLLLALNISAAGTWKSACIADTQGGTSVLNSVNTNVCIPLARQIVKESPDFVIVAGDLIYGNLTVDRTNMLA